MKKKCTKLHTISNVTYLVRNFFFFFNVPILYMVHKSTGIFKSGNVQKYRVCVCVHATVVFGIIYRQACGQKSGKKKEKNEKSLVIRYINPIRRLTVFVVMTPHVHELVGRQFFQFTAVGIPVLFHEVGRFFEIQLLRGQCCRRFRCRVRKTHFGCKIKIKKNLRYHQGWVSIAIINMHIYMCLLTQLWDDHTRSCRSLNRTTCIPIL